MASELFERVVYSGWYDTALVEDYRRYGEDEHKAIVFKDGSQLVCTWTHLMISEPPDPFVDPPKEPK